MADTVQLPDTSSYPKPGNAGGAEAGPLSGIMANPIAALSGLASAQNAMNQNQLFQQTFAMRKALGPIYQQAIGADGNLDVNKLLAGIASHPDTAGFAGDIINQAVQRGLTQAETLNKQLDANQKTYDHIAQTAGGLLAKAGPGGKVSFDDVLPAISNAVALGYIPKEQGLTLISQLPRDPDALTNVIKQVVFANETAAKTLNAVRGNPQVVNTGGGQDVILPSAATGTTTRMGTLENTPTPEQRNTLVPGSNAAGQPTQTPLQDLAPMVGGQGTPISQPGPVQHTAVTGPPAQVTEYLSGKGPVAEYEKDLTNRSADARRAVQTFKEQMSILLDAQGKLKAGIGAGAGGYEAVARIGQALGASPDTVNKLAGGSLSALQEIEKLAVTNAFTTLRSSLGSAASHAAASEFETTFSKGTPNMSMDPVAFTKITQFLDMLQRQTLDEQAKFSAFIQHGQKNNWALGTPNAWQALWTQYLQKKGSLDEIRTMSKDTLKALGAQP